MTQTVLKQSERAFQSAVIDYARLNGWLVAHFHDSRRQAGGRLVGDVDAAGFPDLTLTKNGLLIFAELKSEKGRLSPQQHDWLTALLKVEAAAVHAGTPPCVQAYVFRPSDWPEIERVLGR